MYKNVKEIPMVKIYEPKGRAREYSPFALNYFSGCDHGCQYCYVPRMMSVFRSGYVHENVSCKIDGIWNEAKRFSKSKNGDQQILLSFTGDPYCGYESGQTREVLIALLDHGCHVSVLTKNPGKALKDLDIMSEFENFKIGTTLTMLDEKESIMWETGAPSSLKRLESLKKFAEMGVKTWASFEPVIDPIQSLEMINIVSGWIDHVKIGKINNHPIEKRIDWKDFVKRAVEMCRDLGLKFYIKNDLARFYDGVFRPEERNQDFLNV